MAMTRTTAKDNREWYLASFKGFEKSLNGGLKSPLHRIRRDAIQHFEERGFPTHRDEDWRHTSVSSLVALEFTPILGYDPVGMTRDDITPFAFAGLDCVQLVFVNGHYAPELSATDKLPDEIKAMSLSAGLEEVPVLVETHLSRHTPYEAGAFAALNTAFLKDGAFLHLPQNAVFEIPIHLLFISTGSENPTISHPRNLIVVEANAQASVIESYVSLKDRVHLTNAVTEIVLGENSVLDHIKIQRESGNAFHIGTTHVRENRGCNFTSHNITLGARLARNDITTVLDGEGVESTLNGLYLGSGQQHIDNHTLIEHAQPNCSSHELYKGILNDRAKGVFRGKILVHQAAQKTDAYQSNQNLLLSEEAEATSKPQLEIYADDVKCSHGSTTGQLDADAIFYLRSRGIDKENAIRLLTRSFAGEVIERIKIEPVRTQLDRFVFEKLEEGRTDTESQ